MATQTNKPELKRLPKGQRKNVRRMKQEARKDGTTYSAPKVHRAPAKVAVETPNVPVKE